MNLAPVDVQCHAGFKADETPRRYRRTGPWVEILEVVDRWYEAGRNPEWPLADYFKVRDEYGDERLLRHDRESHAWYLVGTRRAPD